MLTAELLLDIITSPGMLANAGVPTDRALLLSLTMRLPASTR